MKMSSVKYACFALALAAAVAVVLGRPHQQKVLELEQVANMSVCPINVTIDDVPERIPRRIKFIKCADTPNRLCKEHNINHGCCQKEHHLTHGNPKRSYMTECVEINDWVQVTFIDNPKPSQIRVPVGCSCVIQETTTASEIS